MTHNNYYHYFQYKTISKLRKKGMTFNQITDHLIKKKILSAKIRMFRGGHAHSIMKRKRVRDEEFRGRCPEVISDFYLDIYDNSIYV